MSYSIDTNILIYAFNRDSDYHGKAVKFIEDLSNSSEETWIMPWAITHSFLRIITHPGILPSPLSPAHAIEAIEQLFALKNVIPAGETDDFWPVYKKEFLSLPARGNSVPDTQILSILKINGVKKFYSKDKDFLRFESIRVIDPFK